MSIPDPPILFQDGAALLMIQLICLKLKFNPKVIQKRQKKYYQKKYYQIYSAMILSVYGVISKFRRFSSLLIVLFSECTANTLNLAVFLAVPFLFCFNDREPHIFVVMRLVGNEFFGIFICHCEEGAKICAIFTYSLLENQKRINKNLLKNSEHSSLMIDNSKLRKSINRIQKIKVDQL